MFHNRNTQRGFLLFIAGCVLWVVGCGSGDPKRHALSGSVIVEGTPVAKGTISFLPAPGNNAQPAHTSIEDGKYRFSKANGPFAGSHRVVIGIKTSPNDEPTAPTEAGEASGQGIKEMAQPRPPNPWQQQRPVPKKLQWELEYTVPEDGEEQKDFDLSG
jgi:hypothetical protein